MGTFILHSKIGRDVVEEIIRKNFEKNVISIPWDGMHDEAVKKIMKIIEKKT